MKKFFAMAALAGCLGMIGCEDYLNPKCKDDDITVGARVAPENEVVASENIQVN